LAHLIGVVLTCIGVFASAWSSAQEGWHGEVSTDIAFPTKKLAGADLDVGAGFNGTIAYGFTPKFGTYIGWGWHLFHAGSALTGFDVDAKETGYSLGVQWRDRFGNSAIGYRVRAGVTINRIEIENDAGDIVADSKHGVGFEVGAALIVPLDGAWELTPGITYRSLSRDMTIANQKRDVDLRYVAVGVGIVRRF
jgi:Outer membrane protein beta-barrel domain